MYRYDLPVQCIYLLLLVPVHYYLATALFHIYLYKYLYVLMVINECDIFNLKLF